MHIPSHTHIYILLYIHMYVYRHAHHCHTVALFVWVPLHLVVPALETCARQQPQGGFEWATGPPSCTGTRPIMRVRPRQAREIVESVVRRSVRQVAKVRAEMGACTHRVRSEVHSFFFAGTPAFISWLCFPCRYFVSVVLLLGTDMAVVVPVAAGVALADLTLAAYAYVGAGKAKSSSGYFGPGDIVFRFLTASDASRARFITWQKFCGKLSC